MVLSEELDLRQPLTSQHLGILRDVGLIEARRVGRSTVYSVTDNPVTRMVCGLVVDESGDV
jgi:DNA-binding transcriptional ArsR family regulator